MFKLVCFFVILSVVHNFKAQQSRVFFSVVKNHRFQCLPYFNQEFQDSKISKKDYGDSKQKLNKFYELNQTLFNHLDFLNTKNNFQPHNNTARVKNIENSCKVSELVIGNSLAHFEQTNWNINRKHRFPDVIPTIHIYSQITETQEVLKSFRINLFNRLKEDEGLMAQIEGISKLNELMNDSTSSLIYDESEKEFNTVAHKVNSLILNQLTPDERDKLLEGIKKESFISGLFKSLHEEIRATLRKYGIAVATIMLASEMGQQVVGLMFTASGKPALAAAALILPFPILNGAIVMTIKRIFQAHKRIDGFGGRKIRVLYRKSHKSAKRKIKTNGKRELAPIGNNKYLSLKKESIFFKIASLLKLNKAPSLKDLKRKKINHPELHKIISQKGLPNDIKLYLAVLWIETNGSDELKELIQELFKENIVMLKDNTVSKKIFDWALLGFEDVLTYYDIPDWVDLMPESKIGVIIDLIDNVLMPHWTEKLDKVPYFKFRKVYKGWQNFVLEKGKNRLDNTDSDFKSALKKVLLNGNH